MVTRAPPQPCHSPTFVTRTLPSGSPRTETLSNRTAAYKPERNRLRLLSSAPTLGTRSADRPSACGRGRRSCGTCAVAQLADGDRSVAARCSVCCRMRHRQLGREERNRGRQSSCAAADRRRWTGWRPPRSRRSTLWARISPLRTKGRRGFPRRDCINIGALKKPLWGNSAARRRFTSAPAFQRCR
jgi:hypothetical protein